VPRRLILPILFYGLYAFKWSQNIDQYRQAMLRSSSMNHSTGPVKQSLLVFEN
jgi:hypothetical protein